MSATVFEQREDRLLTVEQAADFLQVSAYTLREWAREGKIPALRMGQRYWRFRRSWLDDWIEQNKTGGR